MLPENKPSKWERWSKIGMYFPMVHDETTGKPSVTLLTVYLSFSVALISLITLHFVQILTATSMSFLLFGLCTTFYMLRHIEKAKFDLQNRAFELDGEDNNKKEENK